MYLDGLIDEVLLSPPPSRGRRAGMVAASYVRDLGNDDIQALWDLPEGGLSSEARPLQRITQRHHMLARLVAEGRPDVESSAITGHSPSRISILKKDPAFANLVEYYKTQTEAVYLSVHERLAALGMATVDELMDRIENEPNSFSIRELKEIAELGLDRAGYGPTKSVTTNLSVGLISGDQISKIKELVAQRQNGTVRQITASSNSGLDAGGTVIDGTAVEKEEASREPG